MSRFYGSVCITVFSSCQILRSEDAVPMDTVLFDICKLATGNVRLTKSDWSLVW